MIARKLAIVLVSTVAVLGSSTASTTASATSAPVAGSGTKVFRLVFHW